MLLLCHCVVPAGQIDTYYQYMLKPYDVAAGIVILEEAGGRVTTADGSAYSVFDRSLLATNDALYEQVRCCCVRMHVWHLPRLCLQALMQCMSR
jgi:fructose-1,6-bisphosphatase/inositol monophosphatase family enzyme